MILHLLLFLALFAISRYFLHKFQNLPPTPFPNLPVISHLYLLKKPLHRALYRLCRRYGPVLLLQFGHRRVLVVSSPSAAEECLTKHDIVFANRPRLLAGKHFGYDYTTLAWAPYGEHWRNLRRISSLEILSTNRLQMLSSLRADEVRSLIRRLMESGHQAVEMKTAFFELMLNVMMRMIGGKRYYGDNVGDLDEARAFREIVTETFRLGGAANFADFLPVLKWLGYEKSLKDLQAKRDKFMQSLIEERRRASNKEYSASMAGKKTMIEVLLTLQEAEPEYYSDEIIRGIVLVMLAAGTDTSAGTMEWVMSLLLNHPHILKKAQSEIDENVGTHRLINETDVSKLPYLYCIIKETLRMFPAGPLLVPHESSEWCTIGGFRVPPGTMLLVNLWAIQNDPNIWVDPTEFRPERFEGSDGPRDGFKLMPFGSGRRGCPGEGLALRMVGLTLGSIIQCFDWERVGEKMIDLTEGTGLTMPKAQPLWAKCRPRPLMVNLLSQI